MNDLNEKKMFSVGIPAYKAKFLKECIDSILNQKYIDFELIIVNDASPDSIDEIVSLYADDRIKYFKNAVNFGAENVVDNWNKCLSFAEGKYFILMGDDDRMESNFLEEISKLIKVFPELDIYHCRSYIINENGDKIGLTPSWPEYETVYENIWHRIKSYRDQFISDFVYKTATLKENGGYYKLPLAWGSDDISSYSAMKSRGIAHTNIPLFNYRRNTLTISSTGSAKLKMEAAQLEKEWILNFLKEDTQSDIDETFKISIGLFLNKYVQKKRIRIIVQSYNNGFITQLWYWLCNKKSNELKYVEIIFSILEYIKQGKARKIY